MPNPIRIYVVHHPDSTLAARVRDRIYEWFRMPSMEGIPVYVRSILDSPEDAKISIDTLEYVLPLIDAHMIRDVKWHQYLAGLARQINQHEEAKAKKPKHRSQTEKERDPLTAMVMFPVALDSTAMNIGSSISARNFIRYLVPQEFALATNEKKEQAAIDNVLKHLTEAFSRDLNGRLFPKLADRKTNIFISYARADGTDVPKKLRDFIQSESQCSAFFDENDIGFGDVFGKVLARNADGYSQAMIVVCGDNYAERPWCRWELKRFGAPRRVSRGRSQGHVHAFNPMLVLNTMKGPLITRVIPELGHAPHVRWTEGGETVIFAMLMRQLLFGLRDILAARMLPEKDAGRRDLIVNRLPSPIVLQQLLHSTGGSRGGRIVRYPGNGLPLIELRLLQNTFPQIEFRAFRDVTRRLPAVFDAALENGSQLLQQRVIALSSSSGPGFDKLGYLPQHQREMLVYLLKPLLRLGVDLLYGGVPPKCMALGEMASKSNITYTLMSLLNDERSREIEDDSASKPKTRSHRKALPDIPEGRLFNPSAWPLYDAITIDEEATWMPVMSLHRVTPEMAGLQPWKGESPARNKQTAQSRAYASLAVAQMRQMIYAGFECPTPKDGKRHVKADGCVLLGGKVKDFSGLLPGIFEEFLYAAENNVPVYPLGGFGGAVGILSSFLLGQADQRYVSLLKIDGYLNSDNPGYADMLQGLKEMGREREPGDRFARLGSIIAKARKDGLGLTFNNGLTDEENKLLLGTTDTNAAIRLCWEGMARLCNAGKSSDSKSA